MTISLILTPEQEKALTILHTESGQENSVKEFATQFASEFLTGQANQLFARLATTTKDEIAADLDSVKDKLTPQALAEAKAAVAAITEQFR